MKIYYNSFTTILFQLCIFVHTFGNSTLIHSLPKTESPQIRTTFRSPLHASIPISGCGMFGCEPGLSFLTTLPLPSSPVSIYNPILSSTSLYSNVSTSITHTSVKPTVSVQWIIYPYQELSCTKTSDSLSSGGGCVSQSITTVCTYSLLCNATGYTKGILGLNSSNGDIFYNYSNMGSGRCNQDNSAYGSPLSVPIMDAYGDIITWDNTHVSLIQSGSAAWIKELDPPSICGDVLLNPSVSNTSRVIFGIASVGEIFGYYADGVPIASVILYSNISTSNEFGNSIVVPITTTPVNNGIRFVYIGRIYKLLNTTLPISSSTRPNLQPTNELMMVAMDLHDEGLPRMGLPWQYSLPIHNYPELSNCIPSNNDNTNTGRELLYISGPVLLSSGNTIVFGVSCNSSTLQNYSYSSSMIIFSVAIDAPHIQVPSLLWSTRIPLFSGLSYLHNNYSLIYSRSMFLDATSSGITNSILRNIVWILPENSDSLYGIDSNYGNISQIINITQLYTEQYASLNNTLCSNITNISNYNGILLYGYSLASFVSNSGDNGTMVILNARILQISKNNVDTEEQYVILGLYIPSLFTPNPNNPQLQYCLPTPSNQKILGQITPAPDSSVIASTGKEIFSFR